MSVRPLGSPFLSNARFPLDRAQVDTVDVYQDGFPAIVLQNDRVRVIISPNAGGRSFVFEDLLHRTSAFDSVGALRDDVDVRPPLSTSDRIAKYTHQFPAGFFNRPYDVKIDQSGPRAVVTLSYAAADAFPTGATFTRTLTLEPHSRDLIVDESAVFAEGAPPEQRGVSITSLAVGDPRQPSTQHVLPEGSTFASPFANRTYDVSHRHARSYRIVSRSVHRLVALALIDGTDPRGPDTADRVRPLR